jgi:hypothetical protein
LMERQYDIAITNQHSVAERAPTYSGITGTVHAKRLVIQQAFVAGTSSA